MDRVRAGTQVQRTSEWVRRVRDVTKYANLIIHSVVRDSHWGVVVLDATFIKITPLFYLLTRLIKSFLIKSNDSFQRRGRTCMRVL